MEIQFHKLNIGDYFYFPPMPPEWIKKHEKLMNEITGYTKQKEEEEIDFKKPLIQLVEEFKRKSRKKKSGRKWEYKYRFEVYKKISDTKYEITDYGDKHRLYYPPGTKIPMVFDILIPFQFVEKLDYNDLRQKITDI